MLLGDFIPINCAKSSLFHLDILEPLQAPPRAKHCLYIGSLGQSTENCLQAQI